MANTQKQLKNLYHQLVKMSKDDALETIAEYIKDNCKLPEIPGCVFEADEGWLEMAFITRQAEILADDIGKTDDDELDTLQDMLIDAADIWAIKYQLTMDECKNLTWDNWMRLDDNEFFASVDLDTGDVYEPRQPHRAYEPNATRLYWG